MTVIAKSSKSHPCVRWTKRDTEILESLYPTNTPISHIASILGRTDEAVRGKAKHGGLQRRLKKNGTNELEYPERTVTEDDCRFYKTWNAREKLIPIEEILDVRFSVGRLDTGGNFKRFDYVVFLDEMDDMRFLASIPAPIYNVVISFVRNLVEELRDIGRL